MKNVPINQKYLLTVSESAEYFSIGIKGIRKIILNYPGISFLYGNRRMIIREEAERLFSNLPVNEEGRRQL